MGDRLIKISEAEVIFGASRSTLWRWERDGKIPRRRKVGSTNAWLESEVNAWLDQLKQQQVVVEPLDIRNPSSSKPSPKSPAATFAATISNTPFMKSLGLPMPAWLTDQIQATVDETGNLQYATAAGGTVYCSAASAVDPRNVLVQGGGSYSLAGNLDAEDWLIVESLADLLRLLSADDNPAQGYLILNKPTFAKRAAIYLSGKRVGLILGRDAEGDKLTITLSRHIADAIDYRATFPE